MVFGGYTKIWIAHFAKLSASAAASEFNVWVQVEIE